MEANRFSTYVRPKDRAGRAILDQWLNNLRAAGDVAEIHLTVKGFAVYKLGMIECPDDVD